MISVVPYMNLDGKPSPTDQSGLDHLIEDLSIFATDDVKQPPKAVFNNLIRRVSSEPARVETDLEGRILAINPAFSALCGYSFPEIAGRKPGSFLQGAETESDAVMALRSAIAAREAVEVHLTNYHKDGSPYHVAISITPRANEEGDVIGFQAIERKL
jgi:PAS domain S-box-containing protein